MRTLLTSAAVAAFALVSLGCGKESPTGGTPGTDSTFKITEGSSPKSLKPGDTESVKLTLQRGKDFHKSVRLEAKAPDKISATLDHDLVKDGEPAEVNLKIHPADDAAPGEYKIQVTGTVDNGTPTTLDVKVKVEKK